MNGSGLTRPIVRDLVFAAIYVVQGTVYGFVSFVLLPTLSAKGVSLQAQAGIVALAGAPWVLKLLWAPLVDGAAGRRLGPRAFVSVGLVGVAAALAVLASRGPLEDDVGLLAVAWTVVNVSLALGDVAVDALALDTVPRQERGRTQGFMLGGHHLGNEGLGGMGLGMVVVACDLSFALFLQAALALLVAGGVWLVREAPRDRVRADVPRFVTKIAELVRRPGCRLGLVIASLVLFADVLTSAIAPHFWVHELGWTPERVAERLPLVLLVANLLGYGVAAKLVDRVGPVRAAAGGSGALGILWLVFAALQPLWAIEAFLLGFVVVQAVVTAVLFVGLHAFFMGLVDPATRATHFVVFTVALNLPRVIAPALGAWAVAAWGFAGVFAACGLYQVTMAALIRRTARSEDE